MVRIPTQFIQVSDKSDRDAEYPDKSDRETGYPILFMVLLFMVLLGRIYWNYKHNIFHKQEIIVECKKKMMI